MTDEEIKELKRINKIPYLYWKKDDASLAKKFILEVGWKPVDRLASYYTHADFINERFRNPKTGCPWFINRALKKLLK
jgi:hypothetical protein